MSGKQVYDPTRSWKFTDSNGNLQAAYIHKININTQLIYQELAKVPFTRVYYISKYSKPNRTPRLTWCYGKVDSSVVKYRGLEFNQEAMPPWLQALSDHCRQISIINWGFDPGYNSAIIGKYDDSDDQIAFHFDTETFLAHHFCANVTLGYPRDFQFRTKNPDGTTQTHEIKLGHESVFFFLGLEHALPKRAGVNPGETRYSISFRNMANTIGIGNSYYYCRGLDGAVDNELKREYVAKLTQLQSSS